MTTSNTKESSSDRIAEEAADWFGRIREEELSPPDRRRFAQWLIESPVHVREYLGISEAWGALQSGQHWPEQTSEELLAVVRAAQSENVIPINEGRPPLSARMAGSRPKKSAIGFILAAGLASIAVSAAWLHHQTNRGVYSTVRGEQRSVVLADGSVVQLNTMTRMIVRFEEKQRRIELPEGEAFFRVAADTQRPFEVETPFALVRAIGTEFNVNNRPNGTQVAVVEGKVQVARRAQPAAGRAPQPIALGPQEFIEIGARPESPTATSTVLPETRLATAWMQRRLVFENERVDTAIEEFNRYNTVQMQVLDSQLAALRISGVFSADDPQALMKYLGQIQGVQIRPTAEGFVLRR